MWEIRHRSVLWSGMAVSDPRQLPAPILPKVTSRAAKTKIHPLISGWTLPQGRGTAQEMPDFPPTHTSWSRWGWWHEIPHVCVRVTLVLIPGAAATFSALFLNSWDTWWMLFAQSRTHFSLRQSPAGFLFWSCFFPWFSCALSELAPTACSGTSFLHFTDKYKCSSTHQADGRFVSRPGVSVFSVLAESKGMDFG